MRITTLIIAAIVLCAAVAGQGQSCKYWCKSDGDEGAYYCCPSGKPDTGIAQLMWPLMSSPIFWMGLIGTTLGIHAHAKPSPPTQVPMPMRKKMCPPLRTICPRNFEYYDPPNHCDKDDDCHPMEKCCYDVCLEHKACKPAQ